MAVPGHDERDFEFCSAYGLPIRTVIVPEISGAAQDPHKAASSQRADSAPAVPFTEYGVLVNSGQYDGLGSEAALERMTGDGEAGGFGESKIQYRLKDWGVSRQ